MDLQGFQQHLSASENVDERNGLVDWVEYSMDLISSGQEDRYIESLRKPLQLPADFYPDFKQEVEPAKSESPFPRSFFDDASNAWKENKKCKEKAHTWRYVCSKPRCRNTVENKGAGEVELCKWHNNKIKQERILFGLGVE